MVFTEASSPIGVERADRFEYARAAFELDRMSLPVINAKRLDAPETLERPAETRRGVLSAGKKNECAALAGCGRLRGKTGHVTEYR